MTYGRHKDSPTWQMNNHWVVCDVCGYDYRAKEMRLRWDGAAVCKYDYEPRNAQEFIKGVKDDTSPDGFINVEPVDSFTDVSYSLGGQEDTSIPSGTFNNGSL